MTWTLDGAAEVRAMLAAFGQRLVSAVDKGNDDDGAALDHGSGHASAAETG